MIRLARKLSLCDYAIDLHLYCSIIMLLCRPRFCSIARRELEHQPRHYQSKGIILTTAALSCGNSHLHAHPALAVRYFTKSRGIGLHARVAVLSHCIIPRHARRDHKLYNSILDVSKRQSVRLFSSSQRAMAAAKIDGTAIAKGIREKLKAEIQKAQETNPRYKPSLTIVQGSLRHSRCQAQTLADLARDSWR